MWNGRNQTEYRPIKRVLLKHPRDAYRSQAEAGGQWRKLGYPNAVSYAQVTDEFEAFAVVYSRQMPIPFREELVRRGFAFVGVPDSEHDTFGPNVMAVAPGAAVIAEDSRGIARRWPRSL